MPQQQPTPSLPCCRGAGGEASPAVSPGFFASSRRQKGTHRGLSPGNPPTPHFTAGSRREKRRREALPPLYEEECLCARRKSGVSVAAPRPSPTHTHAFVGAAAPDRGGSSPAPPQIKESADSAAGVSAATAATPRLGAAGPGGGREGGRRRRGRKGRRRKEGSGDEGGGRGERGPTCSAGTRSVCVEEGAPSPPGAGGWRSRRSLPHADGTDPPLPPRRWVFGAGEKEDRRVPPQSRYEEKNNRPPPSCTHARPPPPGPAPPRGPAPPPHSRRRGWRATSPAQRRYLCSAAPARPLLPRPEAGGSERNGAKPPLSSGLPQPASALAQRPSNGSARGGSARRAEEPIRPARTRRQRR